MFPGRIRQLPAEDTSRRSKEAWSPLGQTHCTGLWSMKALGNRVDLMKAEAYRKMPLFGLGDAADDGSSLSYDQYDLVYEWIPKHKNGNLHNGENSGPNSGKPYIFSSINALPLDIIRLCPNWLELMDHINVVGIVNQQGVYPLNADIIKKPSNRRHAVDYYDMTEFVSFLNTACSMQMKTEVIQHESGNYSIGVPEFRDGNGEGSMRGQTLNAGDLLEAYVPPYDLSALVPHNRSPAPLAVFEAARLKYKTAYEKISTLIRPDRPHAIKLYYRKYEPIDVVDALDEIHMLIGDANTNVPRNLVEYWATSPNKYLYPNLTEDVVREVAAVYDPEHFNRRNVTRAVLRASKPAHVFAKVIRGGGPGKTCLYRIEF